MINQIEAAPYELDRLILFYGGMGFDTPKATVLGAISFYKERFLLETIPKEWLSQDIHFCQHLVKLLPNAFSIAIALKPVSLVAKRWFLHNCQKDHKKIATAHHELLSDLDLMAKASVMIDPRIMGYIDSKAHHDPRLPQLVSENLQKALDIGIDSQEVDLRSMQVKMLLADGNGWFHPKLPKKADDMHEPTQLDPKPVLDMHNTKEMKNFLKGNR